MKILRGTTYSNDDALGINKLPFATSRVIPNQRLVRAFGIDNGFTTSDNRFREEFRNWAITKLSTFDEKHWKNTASQADQLVEKQVQIISQMGNSPLEHAVQIVSLKLIFKEFFKLDPFGLSDKTMLEIAQEINHQWIASKSEASGGIVGNGKFKELFESLGLHSDSAKENPLNTFLPVYETLWRVVTHCIIELVFRPSARQEWLSLLEDFLQNPTRNNFVKLSLGMHGVSVEFLVKEALRLYPPTRLILPPDAHALQRRNGTSGGGHRSLSAATIHLGRRKPPLSASKMGFRHCHDGKSIHAVRRISIQMPGERQFRSTLDWYSGGSFCVKATGLRVAARIPRRV